MFAKHNRAVSLTVILLATLPAMSNAETQTEWLQKQLQSSDGNPAPAIANAPGYDNGAGNIRSEGASLKAKQERPVASTYSAGGFRFSGDGRVYLPNGQEISAP